MDFFIALYNRKFRKSVGGITDEARRILLAHDWPGNVRELRNALERAMILEDEPLLRADYLPIAVGRSSDTRTEFEQLSRSSTPTAISQRSGHKVPALSIPDEGTSLEEIEHVLVEIALRKASGNQTQAAKLLDISRDALRYKMKKFGLLHLGEEEAASASEG